MKEKLTNLIDLKSIVTMIMVTSLCIAFFLGKISNEQFVPLVTMIITFYFAKKDSSSDTTTITEVHDCPYSNASEEKEVG